MAASCAAGSTVVMKSRARIGLFDDGIVILAWQNCPPRAVPPASDASHVRCLPVRQFLPQVSIPKHVQLTV